MYGFISAVFMLGMLQLADVEGALLRNASSSLDGRIVGGVETSILYFPHQVSLQEHASHICGAAVLSERFILTAAHCVADYNNPEWYSVRTGSTEHDRGGQVTGVHHIVPHELYNKPTSLNNDIALVVLEQALSFSSYVQPISVATRADSVSTRATLFVSGWGVTSSEQQGIPRRLRYTAVQEIDQSICAASYKGAGTVTTTMMCAGSKNGGRDSCQGDSGGPLVTYVHGVLKLVGVVSWGIGCAHRDYPGIYTRVTDYGVWLQQTMLQN